MRLHLTISGKLIDSITIDPLRRRDTEYIESKKLDLKSRNHVLLNETRFLPEFYTDPFLEEVEALDLEARF